MRVITRTSAISALAAALCVGPLAITPAGAATTPSVTVTDPQNDVKRFDGTPVLHAIDIHSVTGIQTEDTLTATITVDDVNKQGDGRTNVTDRHQWTLKMEKRNGMRYYLKMGYGGEAKDGFKASESSPEAKEWTCKGGKATANRVTNTITFNVPLSCLGNPATIKVGAVSQTVTSNLFVDSTEMSASLPLT